MKTTSNKMAQQAEEKKAGATQPMPQPGEPQPIEQPLVRVEITPLTTWEAIADKMQDPLEQLWKDILPYAHFSIDLPITDEEFGFFWQDLTELLNRHYNGKWDAKADWWHYVVVHAIFNLITADMGYYMDCYEEKNKNKSHEND